MSRHDPTLDELFPTSPLARLVMCFSVTTALFDAILKRGLTSEQRRWPFMVRSAFLIARETTAMAVRLAGSQGERMAFSRAYVNAIPWRTPVVQRVHIRVARLYDQNRFLEALVVRPQQSLRTALHFHGGGYAYFSRAHINLIALLAEATSAEVWVPVYRLTPEHVWPAQLEDALLAYNALMQKAGTKARFILSGDSAGGHLLMMLLADLRRRGAEMPSCGVALSPWLDPRSGGMMRFPSLTGNRDWITGVMAERWARWLKYERDTFVNPWRELWSEGLPPIYIQFGEDEILADMIKYVAGHCHYPGAQIGISDWPSMPHDFQSFFELPEAKAAWSAIQEFVSEELSAN